MLFLIDANTHASIKITHFTFIDSFLSKRINCFCALISSIISLNYMPAEFFRDPRYEIQKQIRTADNMQFETLMIDRDGHWCDIPLITREGDIRHMIASYIQPTYREELHRLRYTLLVPDEALIQQQVHIDMGLFFYHRTDPDESVLESWMPSVIPTKDALLSNDVPYDEYILLGDMYTTTFVLTPAIVQFSREYTTGTLLGLGFNAAVAIEGDALLSLVHPDHLELDRDQPDESRVPYHTLMNTVRTLLYQEN